MNCGRCGAACERVSPAGPVERWECTQCWVYVLVAHGGVPAAPRDAWVSRGAWDATEGRFVELPIDDDPPVGRSRRDPG